MTDDRSDLLAQLAACQEKLAAYVDVVADVVERLGHEGREPCDLLDALGEVEGMLLGKVTNEPHDLAGLAEQVRQALWHRDRARLLLSDARNTCEQRASERDLAILERDAAARAHAHVLAITQSPGEVLHAHGWTVVSGCTWKHANGPCMDVEDGTVHAFGFDVEVDRALLLPEVLIAFAQLAWESRS